MFVESRAPASGKGGKSSGTGREVPYRKLWWRSMDGYSFYVFSGMRYRNYFRLVSVIRKLLSRNKTKEQTDECHRTERESSNLPTKILKKPLPVPTKWSKPILGRLQTAQASAQNVQEIVVILIIRPISTARNVKVTTANGSKHQARQHSMPLQSMNTAFPFHSCLIYLM